MPSFGMEKAIKDLSGRGRKKAIDKRKDLSS